MGNPYKIKRYDFRSDTLNLTPGYRVISLHFWPVYERPSDPKQDLWFDFDDSRGRVLYESPTKTDTVYYNYPDKYINFDKGMMPIGTTKNQDKAKKGWYLWLNFSKPANKGAEEIKKNELKKEKEMVTKHQQGGTMNEQEQIIRQVIQGINQGDPQIMQALSKLDLQQLQAILQSIAQLAQQGDLEAANAINKIQNPQTAKLGTKLSYIKRLKGVCPEGTEKIYLKSGGCMCLKVAKAQEGDTLKIKKNPVLEFKTKKKKLDPATTKTLPKGKYPEDWTAADRAKWEEIHGQNHGDIPKDFDANGGHKGEKWTPKKAYGSKIKK